MRIGFIVDGRAEFGALPELFGEIQSLVTCTLLNPLFADIQPFANPNQIARNCRTGIRQLELRSAELIVVLIDRETRTECPGELAHQFQVALNVLSTVPISVVMKDRKFENWLLSDPAALAAQPARFSLGAADLARLQPNKADGAPVDAILRRTVNGSYDKVQDARKILARAKPLNAGQNSRSFRRFLRVIGVPDYQAQSRVPA